MIQLLGKWARLARFAAIAAMAALVLACGSEPPEKLMASARGYLEKGDRNAAVIQLKNLLNRMPDNGEARLLLGQALIEEEDYPSAEKELARALELKQPHEKVLPLYVRALLALGRNDAVVSEVEKYRLFNPAAVAQTQTAAGEAQIQLGNFSRAESAYAAALAAVPGYPRARLGQAKLVGIAGKLDQALAMTDEVIKAEPKLAEAQGFRADILMVKGDRAGARQALEASIAADTKYLPSRLVLIDLLVAEGDLEGAAKLIESTRKVAPGDLRVAYGAAALAFRRGDLEAARQQSQQILKHLPENVPTLVLLGSVDVKQKQFSAAESNLRKALALAPNHIGARRLLIQTYLRSGQPLKAKETLQPLLERGLPGSDAELHTLAGETFLANGDLARAAKYYEEAAAIKGEGAKLAGARMRLGQIALATGRPDAGFRELEEASRLDPTNRHADLAIIEGHLRRREADKALAAVQALEAKQPQDPLTFQMYGLVHLLRNDVPAARAGFQRALELQPSFVPALFNLAQLDLSEKKPEAAKGRYEAFLKREPNNVPVLMSLAEFQQRTGAPAKEIEATLRRAVSAGPQSAAPRLALIDLLLRSGDQRGALSAAQQAFAALPNDLRVAEATAVAQEAAGEINQAIGTLNKLASMQTGSVGPLYRLAGLHVRQQEPDRAIEVLRRAQKAGASDAEVVPQVAQVYAVAGRHDDALREARSWQKREPRSAGPWALEGDIHTALRQLGEAERAYREAMKLDPKADAVAIKLHAVLEASGKKGEAESWSRKWMAENPRDTAMRMELGRQELARGNKKAAATHYRAVLELTPGNVVALNNLAWIYGELGDPKALVIAEQAVKLAPTNAAVLDTYGMLLVKKGEAAQALPFLEQARKYAPGRKDLRLNYAKALAQAGRKDEARRELESLRAEKGEFAGRDEVAALLKAL